MSLLLSQQNVAANIADTSLYKALHLSIVMDSVAVTQLLLQDAHILVNGIDGDVFPLSLACEYGHAEYIKALIMDPDIDVSIQVEFLYTPLHYAFIHNHPACVQALLDCEKVSISHRDCNWMVLFDYALESKKSEMLLYFFKCMYSSSTCTHFSFHFSVITEDI